MRVFLHIGLVALAAFVGVLTYSAVVNAPSRLSTVHMGSEK